jgi:hypothetical protein
MKTVEILDQKFNYFMLQAVIDCRDKGDLQIVFDGKDFHSEPVNINDKSFVKGLRGYLIKQKDVRAIKYIVRFTNKNIVKCLDYFLNEKEIKIVFN